MRLHTMVRFSMMMVAAFGITLATTDARAEGDVKPSGEPSGPSNASTGSASLKYEHGKGIVSTIKAEFETPKVLGIGATVGVGIDINPVDKGGPLFIVDMPKGANVEASWGTDKKIILKAQQGSSTDGLVTVRHTLTPAMKASIGHKGLGLNVGFDYDATGLLNKMKGANFDYDSKAQQAFAPWGFTVVPTKLNAPALDTAKLFSINMSELPDFVASNVTGELGLRATTKPAFNYKTTKVVFAGASGQLSDAASELSIDATDGDYLEVMTAVEGTMDVAGGMDIVPFIHIDSFQNIPLGSGLDLGFSAFTKEYTGSTPVSFQSVMVHIPMPNVHAPKNVDLGEVKAGGTATKKVTIENTGEKEATMSFSSSNKAFKVEGGTVTVPAKGSYELTVKYSPDGAKADMADITIASNDADSPTQLFKIGANGADVSEPDAPSDGAPTAGSESSDGCGCKAAGHSSMPGWAGFGLLGLGALVVAARRRKA